MNSIPQKPCRKCGEVKPLSGFPKCPKTQGGYANICKVCVNARARVRNKTPEAREWHNRYQRERYANDPAYRKRKRDNLRRRYQTNEEHRRKQKEWARTATQNRRARKQQNGGKYTAKQWRDLCKQYGHQCLACGQAKPLTVDHVIPLAKGGTNDISNIQPLCLDCNLQKQTAIIDYRTGDVYRQFRLDF